MFSFDGALGFGLDGAPVVCVVRPGKQRRERNGLDGMKASDWGEAKENCAGQMEWWRPTCILQKLFAQLESGSGRQRTPLCWSLGTSPWAPQGQDHRTSGACWSSCLVS